MDISNAHTDHFRTDFEARQKVAHGEALTYTFTRKFQFLHPQQSFEQTTFPYFPNEQLFENFLEKEKLVLRFALPKSEKVQPSPVHILTRVANIDLPGECGKSACVVMHFGENNSIAAVVRRLQEIVFANVYHVSTSVEILYIAQYLSLRLQISHEKDLYYFTGNIADHSQIAHLMRVYFRKVRFL